MSAAVRNWGPAVFDLTEGTLPVGRGLDVGLSLAHVGVSRRHAELCLSSGRLIVRDLGSRSGTRVNGAAVRERELCEGDQVQFGPVGYQVRGRQLRLLATADGARLEAHGIVVTRGGLRLLEDIDLSIQPGQFVGLLGASGSGKSTLLKCLAGYVLPAAGTFRCDDLVLPADLESYRAMIGYVPQDDVVFSQLTARENLDYAHRLRVPSSTPVERTTAIGDILQQLGLKEHADKHVRVLSGGQRKRVNVGLELLGQPGVLFLDEPTSGLDPAAETRLMHFLKEQTGRGLTIVCATHVLSNIELFDHLVVIAGGTVAFAGPPARLGPHFGSDDHADLYDLLEERDKMRLLPRSNTPVLPPLPPKQSALSDVEHVPVSTAPRPTQPRLRRTHQIEVLVARGFRQLPRDRLFCVLLVLQPLVIGMLINLSQLRPDELKALFLFAVVTSIWLGLNNTAREVVRERRVYARERLLGVTPEGYLGAKIALFGLIGMVQIFLLVGTLRWCNGLSAENAKDLRSWSFTHMVAVLGMAYTSGMVLGLLVSTLSNSEESAVACLPLLVLPQILLSGVATGLDSSRTGAFRSLVLLVTKTGKEEEARGFLGWVQELASLPMYSRPASALFQKVPEGNDVPPEWVFLFEDWTHAALLLVGTGVALLAVFSWRERSWLERT